MDNELVTVILGNGIHSVILDAIVRFVLQKTGEEPLR